MKVRTADLEQLNLVAKEAALKAGQVINGYTGHDLKVGRKEECLTPASQVVTEVDFKAQEVILEHLSTSIEEYDLGLLTEELKDDRSRLVKDYFWCVDPLDGTQNFVKEQSGYSVSIALISRAGVPQLGVVYDPVATHIYQATLGRGAYRDGEHWELHPQVEGQQVQSISGSGAVMNACRALENAPAFFLKRSKPTQGGGCLWDYAATACIYAELGAWVSDSKGKALDFNPGEYLYFNHTGVLYASSDKVAKGILNGN